MPYQQLRKAVNEWVDLTDRQWEMLAEIFRVREVDANEYLLHPGDHVHQLMFVCSGLLRFYYLAEDGTETVKAFVAEDTFAGPLAECFLDLPVIYGIQAIEPTTLLVAPYADFIALYDEHPIFDRLGRKLAQWLLVCKELRTRDLLQYQAKDRYLAFKQRYPHLIERIPQYHIASYLGITDVSLSRIKRSLRQADALPPQEDRLLQPQANSRNGVPDLIK